MVSNKQSLTVGSEGVVLHSTQGRLNWNGLLYCNDVLFEQLKG